MMLAYRLWWDGDQMHTQEVPLDEVYLQEKDSMDTMDFGDALAALKAGSRVAREGWNGKGMWLHLVTPDNSIPLGYPIQPYIAMKTADDKMQPGWLAIQADMLAEDWVLV